MKKNLFLIITGLFLCVNLAGAAAVQQREGQDRRPMRDDSQIITEEQKIAAANILSQYKDSNLSADDAKAIHQKMRDIGIQGGPAEDELVRASGIDPEILKKLDPPPDRPNDRNQREDEPHKRQNPPVNDPFRKGQGNNNYSIEQAMSDNAQLSTIAFSGLAFITGSAGADTFFPPGKVADFFGFQYMRDVDTAGYGHNTTFLTRVANNVLYILNSDQKAKLVALAKEQAPLYINFAYNRIPLMDAFRMQPGLRQSTKLSLNLRELLS